MLKAIDIKKRYSDKVVLDKISFSLPNRGLVLLTGNNGSGKTTLLNILGGLDTPDDGEILFDGRALSKRERDLRDYRAKNISFIFQDDNLFAEMTVWENINIVGTDVDTKEYIDKLKLQPLLDKKVAFLSGGEKARVAIVRAIAKNSKIILADEPTASIDTESKLVILNILKELSKDRLIILVSHDAEAAAVGYADQKIVLKDGSIENITIENNAIESPLTISRSKLKFGFGKFTWKNLFSRKKLIIRNCILLTLSFLFLFLTLILSSFDMTDKKIATMNLEDDNEFVMTKLSQLKDGSWYDDVTRGFSKEDLQTLNDDPLLKGKLNVGYSLWDTTGLLNFKIAWPESTTDALDELYFYVDTTVEPIIGRKPTKENEMMISTQLADDIIKYGIIKETNLYKPTDRQDLIDKREPLLLGQQEVYVVGICDSGQEKVEFLKENIDNANARPLLTQIQSYSGGNIYIIPEFLKSFESNATRFKLGIEAYVEQDAKKIINENIDIFKDQHTLTNGTIIDHLAEDEIIINEDLLKVINLSSDEYLGKNITINITSHFTKDEEEKKEFIIRGISTGGKIYFDEKSLEKYFIDPVLARRVTFVENSKKTMKSIFDKYYNKNKNFALHTKYDLTFQLIEEEIDDIRTILIILTTIFGLLTIFYIFNYIYNSIENHRKDIAILKSLGIKDSTIIASFILESAMIAMGSFTIAGLIYFPLSLLAEKTFTKMVLFKTAFFTFEFDIMIWIIFVTMVVIIVCGILALRKMRTITLKELLTEKNI